VARVSTDLKRLFVRALAKKVADGESPSIEELLSDLVLARFDDLSSGQIVISRSGDGFSGTFAIPSAVSLEGVTPAGMAALISELMDLRDKSDAFLTKVAKYGLDADTVDEDGWPAPLPAIVDADPTIEESAIADRMLFYLIPAQSSRSDFSRLDVQGAIV
jgi:hypothetical protein